MIIECRQLKYKFDKSISQTTMPLQLFGAFSFSFSLFVRFKCNRICHSKSASSRADIGLSKWLAPNQRVVLNGQSRTYLINYTDKYLSEPHRKWHKSISGMHVHSDKAAVI